MKSSTYYCFGVCQLDTANVPAALRVNDLLTDCLVACTGTGERDDTCVSVRLPKVKKACFRAKFPSSLPEMPIFLSERSKVRVTPAKTKARVLRASLSFSFGLSDVFCEAESILFAPPIVRATSRQTEHCHCPFQFLDCEKHRNLFCFKKSLTLLGMFLPATVL